MYVYQLSVVIVKSGVFLRGMYVPPFFFKEHNLMLCHFNLAALKGAFCIEVVDQ